MELKGKTSWIKQICRAKIKYSGNARNVGNHITHLYPMLRLAAAKNLAANQQAIQKAKASVLATNARRVKMIVQSTAAFTAMPPPPLLH